MQYNFVMKLEDAINTVVFLILASHCYGYIKKRSKASGFLVATRCSRFSTA
ncbi:hypothetical protein ACSTS3_17700 [Aquimarina muelleri]|uniref:hypothetical protein n=1 Tax=Aquimarina muelleri TaxID=279356 RepID=UPI003F688B14